MDIPAVSVSMSQGKLMNDVGIGVLKMATDQMTQQSQQLTQMMAQSVQPHLGSTIDLRV
ncbi:putative motility protein [Paenibacillus lycopersici]|uniref:Putative motility protein n=1 Tax=Paenibacillus lycopersici TaxID=2704462 RepID=A0A6C0G395_9BACL|nr:YjfB family protein [Paenibacillus lycopersici]QHT62211.1 putative motility protein [Paenibacillus lycopersici]